jgi:hypothetical protein
MGELEPDVGDRLEPGWTRTGRRAGVDVVASYLETTKSNSVRMATIPLRGAQRLPFNVELAAGSLAQEHFHGYILQDAIYLGGPHPDDCRCPGSR